MMKEKELEEFAIEDGVLIKYNKDNGEKNNLTMEEVDNLIDFYIKNDNIRKAALLLNYKSSLYIDSEESMRKRK